MAGRRLSTLLVVGAVAAITVSVGLAARPALGQAPGAEVPLVADGLSGVVRNAGGPEAGVWVIAETEDLPTRLIKIVVTDDHGRYVVPELPAAKYKVWVRGYGLVDSKAVEARPGQKLDLEAVTAPDAKAAAEYYPPNYWLTLMKVPAANEFPGTGVAGNGLPPSAKTQQHWLGQFRNECSQCHQLGNKVTREIGEPTAEAWAERLKQARPHGDLSVGDRGERMAEDMQNKLAEMGRERTLRMLADWSKQISEGAVPKEKPPRPQGVERNLVITLWDWAETGYTHDTISTDKRNPSVNANGLVYGNLSNRNLLATLDPKANVAATVPLPNARIPGGRDVDIGNSASAHDPNGGYPHTLNMDQRGRIWTSSITGVFVAPPPQQQLPSYCWDAKNGYAAAFPRKAPQRQTVQVYDPALKTTDTFYPCFGVHHLVFAYDDANTVYFSGGLDHIGWINTRVWDGTHNAEKSQGWCGLILDTKRPDAPRSPVGQWNRMNQTAKPDPTKDTLVEPGMLYGLDISKDGVVWASKFKPVTPSGIVRFDRGAHPPETCRTEYYEPPKRSDGAYEAFHTRGLSVDSKGIVWVAFSSGRVGRFDRSRCKVLSGPTATGQHCPEGWTFYTPPGPVFAGTDVKTDWYYLNWIDTYGVFGLGKDVPLSPASQSDALEAIIPETGQFLTFRVPYPHGYFPRNLDARIDDPNAGWKGRGVWSQYSIIPSWHQEGGLEGYGSQVVKLQLRPSPLAH